MCASVVGERLHDIVHLARCRRVVGDALGPLSASHQLARSLFVLQRRPGRLGLFRVDRRKGKKARQRNDNALDKHQLDSLVLLVARHRVLGHLVQLVVAHHSLVHLASVGMQSLNERVLLRDPILGHLARRAKILHTAHDVVQQIAAYVLRVQSNHGVVFSGNKGVCRARQRKELVAHATKVGV